MSADVPDPVAEKAEQERELAEEPEIPWSRLNPAMLLVHPIRELIRFLPVLLIAIIAGASTGEHWWTFALSGLGVAIGLAQWFTTRFRLTPTHVQLRRGILNRQAISVPRERIRTVDVDSTLLHRIFGLSVVKVGTGASHGRNELELNAVSTKSVPALRAELLRHADRTVGAVDAEVATSARPATPATTLSTWRGSWARYAPFTLTGVASIFVLAAFALQVQFMDGGALTRLPFITDTIGSLSRLPFVELAIGVPVGLIVFVSVVAIVRYVLSYSGFTLKRGDGSLHVSRGLLRTRQVTLDEKRLRGVELSEPWSLRLVGASAALAIMTGLGRERGAVALVSPPGPQQEVMATAEAVLGDTEPLHCELEPHGVRARRRRYTRAIWPIAVLAAAALVLEILGLVGPAVWLSFIAIVPASAALAWDRYRTLGHAILPRWIVTRHGSLGRKRAVLDREGVIGWNIRRSLFQRRAGLATLIVTTAAGRHSYSIPDLPMERVWPIIEEVSGARLASARA